MASADELRDGNVPASESITPPVVVTNEAVYWGLVSRRTGGRT